MHLSLAAGALALLGLAIGHIHLVEPVPYIVGGPQDSPLSNPKESGLLVFPCQGHSVQVDTTTSVTAGTNLRVVFGSNAAGEADPYVPGPDGGQVGTSVHGGGSCQFSISYDYSATSNGTWKTIYTIIGGCPSQWDSNFNAQQHNYCNNSYAQNMTGLGGVNGCMNQFDIPIPAELPGGKASFAWTWFNKIGELARRCSGSELLDL
jgi:hypothetical protein